MSIKNKNIYPDCSAITRTVEVGGLTKVQLIEKLRQSAILMNEAGEVLFADGRFTTSDTNYSLDTVELSVDHLGYPEGATTEQIYTRAIELGLDLCPLELGPHLRLVYLDQPEDHLGDSSKRHQAPSGSITIASEKLSEDYEVPKGFYLRRINGELWLRGYRADHLHVWNPEDRLIFCHAKKP